jgi:sigma-B regulation protein RsbU (phosphoserine phosphatase)
MKFATLIYLLLDLATGEARYVSAAHNPALLVRRGGGVEWLTSCGQPVGAFPVLEPFECRSLALDSGDAVVLYTDGVTEATSDENEFFGVQRLEQLVVSLRDRTAAEIRDAVLQQIESFCADRSPGDDVTLVVVKRA